MKKEVPVDTGRLKRRIRVYPKGKGHYVMTSEALSPGSKKDYAPIIDEYGGRFKKGIGFFAKGVNKFKSVFRSRSRELIRKTLNSK